MHKPDSSGLSPSLFARAGSVRRPSPTRRSLISLFISPLSVSIGHSSHTNVRVAISFSDEAARETEERSERQRSGRWKGGVNFHKFPVICAPFLHCPFATKYTVRGTSVKMVLWCQPQSLVTARRSKSVLHALKNVQCLAGSSLGIYLQSKLIERSFLSLVKVRLTVTESRNFCRTLWSLCLKNWTDISADNTAINFTLSYRSAKYEEQRTLETIDCQFQVSDGARTSEIGDFLAHKWSRRWQP